MATFSQKPAEVEKKWVIIDAEGVPTEPLSKERIAELSAELERLQNQAAAFSRPQP